MLVKIATYLEVKTYTRDDFWQQLSSQMQGSFGGSLLLVLQLNHKKGWCGLLCVSMTDQSEQKHSWRRF